MFAASTTNLLLIVVNIFIFIFINLKKKLLTLLFLGQQTVIFIIKLTNLTKFSFKVEISALKYLY